MGMEVRSTASGPDHIRVELGLKIEGKLKGFSQVDLLFGEDDNPPLRAPLREDRSKPGRVVVNFTADRTQLDFFIGLVPSFEVFGSFNGCILGAKDGPDKIGVFVIRHFSSNFIMSLLSYFC